MKTLVWLVLASVLLISAAAAYDTGEVTSMDGLDDVIRRLNLDVVDYNRDSGRNGVAKLRPWIGIIAYCVCAEDRGTIIYATEIRKFKDSGGVASACRRAADKCGGCYGRIATEYVKVSGAYMRKR